MVSLPPVTSAVNCIVAPPTRLTFAGLIEMTTPICAAEITTLSTVAIVFNSDESRITRGRGARLTHRAVLVVIHDSRLDSDSENVPWFVFDFGLDYDVFDDQGLFVAGQLDRIVDVVCRVMDLVAVV